VATAVAGRLDVDPNGRVAWLLVAGTIPAGLIGLFLETPLKHLFANPLVSAGFLVVNGIVLLIGERARRRALAVEKKPSSVESNLRPFVTLGWRAAVLVGLAQSLALIPGISRSGVTMVAALRAGMSHEDAAAYTFLLATPIIAAAGLLEIPQLAGTPGSDLAIAVIGGILSGVAAYLSTKFLMRYFEKGRLDPFGYYCILAGLVSGFILSVHP
jgi:undecaprenyl-diphosphatase